MKLWYTCIMFEALFILTLDVDAHRTLLAAGIGRALEAVWRYQVLSRQHHGSVLFCGAWGTSSMQA